MPKHRKWDSSNPLYRWMQKHHRKSKPLSSKTHDSTSRTRMAKRKRSFWNRRLRRHHKKARIPLEMLIAGGTIPLTPAATGFGSILDCVQGGDFIGVADNLKVGFLGFDPDRNASTPNFMALLNPFDMEHGRFTKMLIIAGLIGTVRRKLVPATSRGLERIPLLGKYVS